MVRASRRQNLKRRQELPPIESRSDFQSISPFLPPLIPRSPGVVWPSSVVEALKRLSKGPLHSNVSSGQPFARAIADLRNSLGFSSLHAPAPQGLSFFFDNLLKKDEAENWFTKVVPKLADLLLRLPALLETHYQNVGVFNGMETGLRLLEEQESGIVFLSQELIAALLACGLFCLFPTSPRGAKKLPRINFNELFVCLYEQRAEFQEHKIRCIVHYFERICSEMPAGNVSFERKVLSRENSPSHIVYPKADFWSKSTFPLCKFEVNDSCPIEDQLSEALEVDFADKSIGGMILTKGCVQEEIRFMINPELIVSMLFLPVMADNEAIEMVGAERFSNYTGYAKEVRFNGDHVDKKGVDKMGRRRTRVIAIDALRKPEMGQYELRFLLRETNKAFCGFSDHHKNQHEKQFEKLALSDRDTGNAPAVRSTEEPPTSSQADNSEGEIGVATGNWGCGVFGGDPEVKTVMQWLAASEASRPFMIYHSFGLEALQRLDVVVQWIVSQEWTVGKLWNVLVEYSTQRRKGETTDGLFNWLIPLDRPKAVQLKPAAPMRKAPQKRGGPGDGWRRR